MKNEKWEIRTLTAGTDFQEQCLLEQEEKL
jgi:hypothetical protein